MVTLLGACVIPPSVVTLESRDSPRGRPVRGGPTAASIHVRGPASGRPVHDGPAGGWPVCGGPTSASVHRSGPTSGWSVHDGPAWSAHGVVVPPPPVFIVAVPPVVGRHDGPAGGRPVCGGPTAASIHVSGPASGRPVHDGPAGGRRVDARAAGCRVGTRNFVRDSAGGRPVCGGPTAASVHGGRPASRWPVHSGPAGGRRVDARAAGCRVGTRNFVRDSANRQF